MITETRHSRVKRATSEAEIITRSPHERVLRHSQTRLRTASQPSVRPPPSAAPYDSPAAACVWFERSWGVAVVCCEDVRK